jgi:hypothetical protein
MLKSIIIFAIIICGCTAKQNDTITGDVAATMSTKADKYSIASTLICNQTNLSNQFDIAIDFKRYHDSTQINDSCTLKVLVNAKQTKAITDSFSLTSLYYFDITFSDCNNVTSYTTKFNSDRKILDNYFGDIVVADLNFDKKDDIAFINDNGGSSGPSYSYYIQDNDKKFRLDSFLTDTMTFFPTIIDKKKLCLTTYAVVGACCMSEDVYRFDKAKNHWQRIKHKIHGP